jgi:hypothetical protein
MMIPDEEIGGARVLRTFKSGPTQLKRGHVLTRDEILSIRPPNRRALLDAGYLQIMELAPPPAAKPPAARLSNKG